MAKNIVISGSTYAGVEQVNFQTANGGTAAFVDADTKKEKATAATVSCHAPTAFAVGVAVPQAIPTTTISVILGV